MIDATDAPKLNGRKQAAAIMLALGEEGKAVWKELGEDDVRDLTAGVVDLGIVPIATTMTVLHGFIEQMNMMCIAGGIEDPEAWLTAIFSEERAREVMNDLANTDRSQPIWERMEKLPESVLASYLAQEQPQTAALILSKLEKAKTATVLSALPETLAGDIIMCMLRMESVPREALASVELVLQKEFATGQSRQVERDPHANLADVFNSFDRATEMRMMKLVESRDDEAAERIRSLMFTFEDLKILSRASASAVVRRADKANLALALKGANPELRDIFLNAMASRAANLMREEIEGMGPRRMRDVQQAQTEIVALVKQLEAEGVITLEDSRDEDYV